MNLICTPKILSNNSFPSLDFSRFLAIFYPKSLFVVCVLSQNGGHPHWSRPTVSGVSLRERRLWFRIFWRRFRFVSEFWGSVETTRVSNITRNIAKRLLTEVSEEVRAGSLRLWVIIGGNGASFWNYDCRFFLFFHRSGDATVIRRVVRRFSRREFEVTMSLGSGLEDYFCLGCSRQVFVLVFIVFSSMAVLAWNVRGLGNRESVRGLMNSIRKSQPNIIFISETKQKMRYLEKIKMKLEHSFYVEPIGSAGGLALWWSKEVQIKILGHGKLFIDAEISGKGESVWFGTFIYGPPYKDQKRDFWEFMKNLRDDNDAKWLVIGDSNVVSCQDEKVGGLPFNPIDANSFFDFVDSRGLIDMPITGGAYTWSNQRSDNDAILEKLDRVLCSTSWNIAFPKAVVMLDIAMGSDHAPIIIYPLGLDKKGKKDFKFESKWLLEEDCSPTVKGCWERVSQPRHSHRFGSKLRRTKWTLLKWSKLRDRVKNLRKIELRRRIEHFQGKQLTREELSESISCKKELDQMWENEERYWHQRAQTNWL
ncbi:hypothetical protein V6N11_050270 [Hibiscus sabdariffa]|uniref:Endonuclease/exonuclease/phosphatase domain-containing protein n=1 Tax=Hibiscus sabdariffa TaxID=183260 RepID=A0ABR2T9D4_9ROSI